MKELLEDENPLFGRFAMTMHLKAFDYYDSARFYPGKSIQDKIDFYAVFGGNPFINAELREDEDLKSSIIRV